MKVACVVASSDAIGLRRFEFVLDSGRVMGVRYGAISIVTSTGSFWPVGTPSTEGLHATRSRASRPPTAALLSLLKGALIEKANHLAPSIRALRIHVRATWAPAKPRVTAFMYQPML